jgi:hypothetical protein
MNNQNAGDIVSRLRDLRAREHECTVEIIRQMIVCYETRAHLEHGCPTLFSFLVEELKYSAGAASRRYKAMRVAMRIPRVLDMLARHELTLCTLARAESLLGEVDEPEALLDRIRGKSTREVEKVVAEHRPVPRRPRESVKPVVVTSGKRPLFGPPTGPSETRYSVRTTLAEPDYDDFEKVRAILSRKKPGASVEDVLVELTQFYLKHRAAKPRKQPARNTKQIPRATRDAVMIRDGHRCTFVGRNGKRCSATHDLQIDHITPRAIGGSHEPANLRVLCGAHNRYEARRILGGRVPEAAPRSSSIVGQGAKIDAGGSDAVPPSATSSSAGTTIGRYPEPRGRGGAVP